MKRINIAAILLSLTMITSANADWSVTKGAKTNDGAHFQVAIAEKGDVSALIVCMIEKNEFKFSITTPDYVPQQPPNDRKWFMLTINGNTDDPYYAIANGGDFFDANGETKTRSVEGFIRKIRMKRTLTILTFDNAADFGTRTASDSQDITLMGVTAATNQLDCTI